MTSSTPFPGHPTSKIKLNALYFLVAALFFIYVLVRAFSVGATIDEIATMEGARDLSFLDIISQSHPTANNHVLNSLLIKVLFPMSASSLAIVRLPNVLSFILYLHWGYKISFGKLSSFVGLGCFALLMCNPFLLDFFSLARGYGLALGFMMGALYFGAEFFASRSTPSLIKALLLASLSVLSLFSMIYFWAGLAATLTLACILRRDWAALKKSLFCSLIIGLTLLGCIAVPVFRLKESGSLYYGGHNGFYSDTLVSLVRYSLYSLDITSIVYLSLNLCLGSMLLFSVVSYFTGGSLNSLKSVFLGVSVISVALLILAHHLVGVLYPINRVGLFLYPLFILSLCFCLNDLSRYVRVAILSLFLGVFTVNLLAKGNFYRTALWSFDAHTEEILNQVNERGKRAGTVVRFACTPVIYPSVNYYVARNGYTFLKVVKDGHQLVPTDTDYYLLSDRDTASFSEEYYIENYVRPLDSYDKAVFIAYPEDNLIVFENLRKHSGESAQEARRRTSGPNLSFQTHTETPRST